MILGKEQKPAHGNVAGFFVSVTFRASLCTAK